MSLIPTFQLTPDKVNGTEVYICAGVPCDNTYQDIWTYPAHNGTVADQVQLFLNNYLKQVYNSDGSESAFYYNGDTGHPYLMTNHAFGDEQNTLIIPTNASNISNCNYVIFRIISQGVSESASVTYTPNKVYFAFINRIEYISALATKVYYEIDYFQTYYRDIQIKNSFIERATTNEAFLSNTVEDYTDISYYKSIYKNSIQITIPNIGTTLADKYFNVFTTEVPDVPITDDPLENRKVTQWFTKSKILGGVYTELNFASLPYSTISQDINNLTTNIISKLNDDAIQGIMLSRYPIVAYDDITNPTKITVYPNLMSQNIEIDFSSLFQTGYDPKLYTYPYCKILLHTAQGITVEYKPEELDYHNGNKFYVKIKKSFGLTPTMWAYIPTVINSDTKIVEYNDSVMCNWNRNEFQTWWNNNSSSFIGNNILSALTNVISGSKGLLQAGASGLSGTMGGLTAADAGLNLIGTIGGGALTINDKRNVPDTLKGMLSSNIGKIYNNLNSAFQLEIVQADSASCARMTSYFRMYGYAYNQVQSGTYITKIFGNNGGRGPYLKLNNPIIMPIAVPLNSTTIDPYSYLNGVPTNAMTKIKRIFTNGFRCWDISSPKQIGNYQQ